MKSLHCFAVPKKSKKEVIEEKKQKRKAEEVEKLEKVRIRRDHMLYLCEFVWIHLSVYALWKVEVNWQKLPLVLVVIEGA